MQAARLYNTHTHIESFSLCKRVSCRLSTRFTEAKYRFGFDKELVKREKHSFSLSDLAQVAAFSDEFLVSHSIFSEWQPLHKNTPSILCVQTTLSILDVMTTTTTTTMAVAVAMTVVLETHVVTHKCVYVWLLRHIGVFEIRAKRLLNGWHCYCCSDAHLYHFFFSFSLSSFEWGTKYVSLGTLSF